MGWINTMLPVPCNRAVKTALPLSLSQTVASAPLTNPLCLSKFRLNLTITPKRFSALVFNNCLDNGEPDERSQHEGRPPVTGIKYAINGWVRSKNLYSTW